MPLPGLSLAALDILLKGLESGYSLDLRDKEGKPITVERVNAAIAAAKNNG